MKQLVLIFLATTFSYSVHAEKLLDKSRLTLKQKVSQMFIFGFKGHEVSEDLEDKLNHLQPGAVVVFGRNINSLHQISKLNYDAQNISLKKTGLPLLIAVDQEGGSVIRIRTSPSLPSALTLGKSGSTELVEEAGKVTGDLLQTLGFNINLAPVVDITDENVQGFIANRAFSSDPSEVSNFSTAFARGLYSKKVIPVAKHFPGHGKIFSDSHVSTPYKKQTLNELLSIDLLPFTTLFKSEVPVAVMVAHVAYPLIDTTGTPATFSKSLVSGILRTQLNFKGIAITDDIEMAGTGSNDSVGEKAIKAIEAGNDLIMIGWYKKSQKEAIDAVFKAVKSGRISQQRIEESVDRIISYKNAVSKINKLNKPELIQKKLGQVPFRKVFDKIIANSFLSQDTRAPASTKAFKEIFVTSSSMRFYTSFKKVFFNNTKFIPLSSLNSSYSKIARADLIIVNVFNQSSASEIKRLAPEIKKKIFIVNSGPNKFFQNENEFFSIANIYSTHPDLGRFTAEFIKSFSGNSYSLRD